MKPLAIDLYCGLGGWGEGFLAEGYDVVGFDNCDTAPYAMGAKYPGQLVIQDVLTLHGSQFRNAAVIVASPPCQNYSYLAMPWSRSSNPENSKAAKALRRKWETEGPDNRLFDACFRIQREAIEATRQSCICDGGRSWGEMHRRELALRSGESFEMEGILQGFQDWSAELLHADACSLCNRTGSVTRYIPLIVENVRGAQPWVGRSAWNYGSFHLWGDVPALMPINVRSRKAPGNGTWFRQGDGYGFAGSDMRKNEVKVPGFRFDGSGRSFQTASVETTGQKVPAYSDPRRNGGKGVHLTSPAENADGIKIGGHWFSDPNSPCQRYGSRSNARKAASALIAKIPFELASHIARVYHPTERAA